MRTPDPLEQEYQRLMGLFFRTVDSMKDTERDKWLSEVEVLAAKLFNHLDTIHYLRRGTALQLPGDQPRTYVDHSSISVITRAAFETYLTFNFIYCDYSVSIEKRQFRHSVWILKGFLDRQSFTVIRKEHLYKREVEKRMINDITATITNANIFAQLTEKQKRLATRGEWRGGKSWEDLSDIAGFNRVIFRDLYNYLSAYSHSGGHSALQIGQALSISQQRQLTNISLHLGLILMSHFIIAYRHLFPDHNFIDSDDSLEHLLNKWHITWREAEFLKTFE
jgi:hypothetical protein